MYHIYVNGGGGESESEWKGNGESVFTYTVNHDLLVDR